MPAMLASLAIQGLRSYIKGKFWNISTGESYYEAFLSQRRSGEEIRIADNVFKSK